MDRASSEASPFLAAYRGRLVSALRWHQLDALWERIAADAEGGWYVYAVGEAPPAEPAAPEALRSFLAESAALLRREHEEDYCGIVYADDLAQPSFVKIYDPANLGVVCGYSEAPPLPGWTLSKTPPVSLPDAFPQPGGRRRWWQRLMGRR
jgi:hypothetical protein